MKLNYMLGIGNYSMFDDSIALKLVEHICENNLDNNFQAVDLSGNSMNLLTYLNESTGRILLVDTADMDMAPGEFKTFVPEDVRSEKELSNITSHEGDILKVLALAKKTGHYIPDILIMGIQPEIIKPEFGLSETLLKKFNSYVEKILSIMNS